MIIKSEEIIQFVANNPKATFSFNFAFVNTTVANHSIFKNENI